MHQRAVLIGLLGLVAAAYPLSAQSVVLDEGSFAITVDGRPAGTEEFSIRRSGVGVSGTVIANAVISLDGPDGSREIRPLLAADASAGAASQYQVKVTGAESIDLRLSLVGRRYVSVIRSDEGEEEREFRARPETRILEAGVAHHYYFLRGLREGGSAPAIEPRTSRQFDLEASAWREEEILLGRTRVSARRVIFGPDSDRRLVWYDRQGRVLRVEVPSIGYVAERRDLVGMTPSPQSSPLVPRLGPLTLRIGRFAG